MNGRRYAQPAGDNAFESLNALRLLDAGVAAVDVAGAGGTNWALVEGQRDARARAVAAAFRDWGWPTAETLAAAVALARPRGVPVIASGGITDGVEAAIAIALGAAASLPLIGRDGRKPMGAARPATPGRLVHSGAGPSRARPLTNGC